MKYAHAKCLLANNQFTACKEELANTVILPSEGARYGRLTYRQACIMEALEYLEKGNCRQSLISIREAKLWPENLGVGRPFDVDERIEDFVEAICRESSNEKKSAERLYNHIVEFTDNQKSSYSSVDFLHLISLKRLGKDKEVQQYLDAWEASTNDPGVVIGVRQFCKVICRKQMISLIELRLKRVDHPGILYMVILNLRSFNRSQHISISIKK